MDDILEAAAELLRRELQRRGGASLVVGDDLTESVARSQSGRIVQGTVTDGAAVQTSTYSFDAAGRLVLAVIPRHELA